MDTRPPDSSAGNHRAGSYHASQLSTFSTGPEPEGRDQVPERDFKHLAGALRPEVAEAAQTKNPHQQDGDSCLNKSLATYNTDGILSTVTNARHRLQTPCWCQAAEEAGQKSRQRATQR